MSQLTHEPRTGACTAIADSRADGDLVRGALAGQHDDWEILVRRHQAYLYRVARSFRLDEATCEDAVQTTWLRLIEHAGSLRDPEYVSAWLVTTLRRHVFSVFRSRGQAPELAGPAIAELPDPGRSPEQEVTAGEQNAQVSAALRRLPSRDQTLLTLLMDSPVPSYRRLAAQLRMPVGSIGPSRARSLGRLRRELDAAGMDRELMSA